MKSEITEVDVTEMQDAEMTLILGLLATSSHYKKIHMLQGKRSSQFPCKSQFTRKLQGKHIPRKSVLVNVKRSQFPRKFARENSSSQICDGIWFFAKLRRKINHRKFAMEYGSSRICNRTTKHSFLANFLKKQTKKNQKKKLQSF